MRVNWMVADHAMTYAGRLFITGAGVSILVATPVADGYAINFGIGLTINVPWDAMGQEHRMVISLTDANGEGVPLTQSPPGSPPPAEDACKIIANFTLDRGPSMIEGEDAIGPVAFQFTGLKVPRPGPYTLRVEIDGVELASTLFRVQTQASRLPAGLALAEH